jgi:hypothetical protein
VKRFPFGGWTSKLPPPDAALWQALEVECKHTLSEDDRIEIERACHAYKMAVIARTQNGNAESVGAVAGGGEQTRSQTIGSAGGKSA